MGLFNSKFISSMYGLPHGRNKRLERNEYQRMQLGLKSVKSDLSSGTGHSSLCVRSCNRREAWGIALKAKLDVGSLYMIEGKLSISGTWCDPSSISSKKRQLSSKMSELSCPVYSYVPIHHRPGARFKKLPPGWNLATTLWLRREWSYFIFLTLEKYFLWTYEQLLIF